MKRSRKIVLLILSIVITFVILATYNFQNDRNNIINIHSLASNGEIPQALNEIENMDPLKNPLLKVFFYFWNRKFQKRFCTQEEKTKKISSNHHINKITEIYRDYWKGVSMNKEMAVEFDSILFKDLSQYIILNKLSDSTDIYVGENPIASTLQLIERESFYSTSFYLNEMYGLKIWDKQSEKNYHIELPHDTLDISVLFIKNYVLRGMADYFTIRSIQDGGWASSNVNTLFCNKGAYWLKSEKFNVSYLKHEANHFVDMNKYPELSGADLEYRSKLIELMYLDKKIFSTISFFIQGASIKNRNNSHAYANYYVIHELSKLIFNVEFESDLSKWKTISKEEINKNAEALYEKNNEVLDANPILRITI